MSVKLIVRTPDIETFNSYWYGHGEIIGQAYLEDQARWETTVDYGDDEYRAQYQAGRFASGLYFAKVEM